MKVSRGWMAVVAVLAFAARAAMTEYEGHDLRYWEKRADYYRMKNPINYHDNDGLPERLLAIAALGNFGSNAVPKLKTIIGDEKREVVERWTAIDALKEIGPAAQSVGPLLIAFATNNVWQGKSVSETGTGKAVDALAAVNATNEVPQLLALFADIYARGAELGDENRDRHLYRLIGALGKLAQPKDAKVIVPLLEKLAEEPPPATKGSFDWHGYLVEAARNYLKKLSAAK